MKKIIAAFDGLRFSESTLQYAIWLAQQQPTQITAVFLTESNRLGYELYETIVEQSIGGKEVVEQIDKADAAVMAESIHRFETACREAKIHYSVHRDNKMALTELLQESVFADALIIEAEETFSYLESNLPGSFIKHLLHKAECPLVVLPRKFTPIHKFVFLYDGHPSSVFAMKMFSYTMPKIPNAEVEIIFAKESNETLHLPHNKLIREWAKTHFPGAIIKVLKGGEDGLAKILSKEDPGIMVIAGAYDRSTASMIFHGSLADKLMNVTDAPLFIAHS
jgi:hypothetical protein